MSLTDDWKAGKLKNGWYFCLYENDAVFPALCFDDDFDDYALKVTEVLAPCDFDHFVELNEKVKELEKDIETITNNYKLLEKKQAVDIAHGQALVDEFGDYEALYQELIRLKREVAKGDRIIGELFNEGNSVKEENKQLRQLLERGTQLLSFEHEEYEVMSFVSEVNEVLK